jgi:hypothetical protein
VIEALPAEHLNQACEQKVTRPCVPALRSEDDLLAGSKIIRGLSGRRLDIEFDWSFLFLSFVLLKTKHSREQMRSCQVSRVLEGTLSTGLKEQWLVVEAR